MFDVEELVGLSDVVGLGCLFDVRVRHSVKSVVGLEKTD